MKKKKPTQQPHMDITLMPEGIYLLSVTVNNDRKLMKIVKGK